MTMLIPYDPNIPDPYPAPGWRSVENFKYLWPLVLYRDPISQKIRRGGTFEDDDADYVVYGDYTVSYTVDGVETKLTVPSGMLTDLSTVPKLLRGFVGKVGRHLEASIVHDFLFVAWQLIPGKEAKESDWRFADAVMAAGLKKAMVSRIDQVEITTALKLFGWDYYKARDPGPFFFKLPKLSLPADATAP